MNLFLAVLGSLAGIATLYACWRRSGGRTRPAVVGGWLLICLSAVFWVRFGGSEFGTAYVMMAIPFVAWSFVTYGQETRRPGERRRQPRILREAPERTAIVRTLARFVVAVPLAGAASMLASVASAAWLPWDTADRYVFAITVAPIAWGILAVWVGVTARLSSVAILLASVSAVCSLLLFVR